VKQIGDREKRNRVDVGAAKRFVESGIWNPGDPKKRRADGAHDQKRQK
jgi:hypothetical protein